MSMLHTETLLDVVALIACNLLFSMQADLT